MTPAGDHVWGRRAVSIPLYVVLFVLGIGLLPLWLPGVLIIDALARDRRLPRTRASLFFLLHLTCEVWGVLGSVVVWGVFAGGALGGRTRYLEANAALQRLWSTVLFGGAGMIFDFRVETDGAELAKTGPFLLFVRHSSTADTLLAAWVVANPNRILLRYVLKKELLWDPCLDIVGRRLPNAFLDRSAEHQGESTAAIARLARDLDERSGVLIYPEGTRFSPKKLAASVERLRSQGRTQLAEIASGFRCVLPPRLAGPLTLLEAAPGVDVVFMDQKGFEGAATFGSFWRGALIHQTIRVRLRRVHANDIPTDHRERWLFEQWQETERFVAGDAI